MAIECGVITAILVVITIVFFRTKRKKWGLATLPIMLLPVTEFVLELLFVAVFKVPVSIFWGIFVLMAAVAISCAWIGLVSDNFSHKSTKVTYIGMANGFNLLLAAILINNILAALAE